MTGVGYTASSFDLRGREGLVRRSKKSERKKKVDVTWKTHFRTNSPFQTSTANHTLCFRRDRNNTWRLESHVGVGQTDHGTEGYKAVLDILWLTSLWV